MSELPPWAIRLRSERQARDWSLARLARNMIREADGRTRAHLPKHESLVRMIRSWEAGKHRPREPYPQLLARALGIAENVLFADKSDTKTDEALHPLIEVARTLGVDPPTFADTIDMDTLRRRLIQTLSVLGLTGALPTDALANVRRAVTPPAESVEDWEEIAWGWAHALSGPPGEILSGIADDLVALRRTIDQAPDADRRDLTRVSAQLSMVVASALGLIGSPKDSQESHRWWRAAQMTAEDCGDSPLASLAYALDATQALYERRDDEYILRRIRRAMRAAGDRPCPGMLQARSTYAILLAQQERTAAARAEVAALVADYEAASSKDGPALVGGWRPARVYLYQSAVYSIAGDLQAAEAAQDAYRVGGTPHTARRSSLIELHRARCLVAAGDVRAGIEHARDVVSMLPGEQRSLSVRGSASDLLAALPAGARELSPARDLQALTAGPRPV